MTGLLRQLIVRNVHKPTHGSAFTIRRLSRGFSQGLPNGSRLEASRELTSNWVILSAENVLILVLDETDKIFDVGSEKRIRDVASNQCMKPKRIAKQIVHRDVSPMDFRRLK